MSKRAYAGDKKRAEIALARLLAEPKPAKCERAIDASRAKITIAPPFVDRRFAADPGHVGAFARAGIGRYVDPEDEIETEGMGL